MVSRLPDPPFWRAVWMLSSGSALAMVAALAAVVVLPRVYKPEAFGQFGVFLGCVSLLGGVFTGGYDLAIMLPAGKEEARRLGFAGLIFAAAGLALTAAATGMVSVAGPQVFFSGWGGWQGVIPYAVMAESLVLIAQGWKNRCQQYRLLALVRWLRPSAQALASIALGLWWEGPGLIASYLLGQAVSLALLAPRQIAPPSWLKIRKAMAAYGDFPRFSMVSQALNQASRQLPFILFPYFFGAAEAGFFTQADRVLMLPMALVSLAAGQVFYQRAARIYETDPRQLAPMTWKLTKRLCLMIAPFAIAMIFFGPQGFAWVMGETWRPAGAYARWLAPWLMMAFLASPLSFIIDIRRKLLPLLWFNLVLFLARVGSLAGAALFLPPLACVALYGMLGAVLVGLEVAWFLRLAGVGPVFLGWKK